MSAKPYPATLRNWPTFRRVIVSMLAIDAGILAAVWIAWRITA